MSRLPCFPCLPAQVSLSSLLPGVADEHRLDLTRATFAGCASVGDQGRPPPLPTV